MTRLRQRLRQRRHHIRQSADLCMGGKLRCNK